MSELQHSSTDIQVILSALKDNRTDVTLQLNELDRKFDSIPVQLESLRKETRDSNDALRRELQAYFVAKSEFTPFQTFVMNKFNEYDRIVTESRSTTPEWIGYKKDVEALKKQVEDEEKKKGSWLPAFAIVISLIISASGFVITALQHFSFHP